MPETLSEWTAVLAGLLALGVSIRGMLTSTATENSKKIVDMQKEQIDIRQRLQAVEGELRHMPDRETTHRLELAMSEVNGRLSAMDERLKPVAAISERVQELLLQRVHK